MIKFRFLATVLVSLLFAEYSSAATCTISARDTADATTCSSLVSGDTMLITDTLILTATYSVQSAVDITIIVDGGRILWAASADFNVGVNSVFQMVNGGEIGSASGPCNAAKRISFGGTTVISCNGGGGGAVADFTAFNTAGGANSSGPLPVELIQFGARTNMGSIILNWTTASELNNSHFEIERSSNGHDFTMVGVMKGMGTTNAISNYIFQDQFGTDQLLYYRLKQVDFNGTHHYSPIISVRQANENQENAVEVYPNPLVNKANLRLNLAQTQQVTITIVNQLGTKVAENSMQLDEGVTVQTVDLSQYPSGIYFVEIQLMNKKEIVRINKL